SYNPKYVYKAYEIIHTNLEHDYVYLLLENYYNRTDMSTFSVDNFIDCNLFIQFAYARDNRLYNNTYFTMKAGPAGYNTVMTMWDTDISFGKKSVNGYNYEETIHTPMEREDTDSIRALHPDYDRRAYDRWQMLRQDVLSEENIAQHIENCMAEITFSSSLTRDYKKWGIGEDSADTLEGVENFIAARLPWLDGYLAQQAESAIL
ncbi:MAG: CotH kinase family protein, partial [Oscillospiraceae bacterium]|nr:CotH kinase family protein [Oscillospiraceae bacterium]